MGDRLRGWLPVAVWAGVITLFSSSWFSGEHTSSVLLPILSALLPGVQPDDVARVHGAIRKLAHVAEYWVLGALILRALLLQGAARTRAPGIALALGTLFAAGDELHQAFVPTRTAAAGDVLIDTAGVAAGVGLWLIASTRRDGEN